MICEHISYHKYYTETHLAVFGCGYRQQFPATTRLKKTCWLRHIRVLVHWHPYLTRGSAHWACIAHLTIEWYWSKFQREIIITLKNSSHLEWRVGLSDTILKGTHPGTIYAKFGSIWPSCFRGEDLFNISQSEKRINLGGHVCRPNGTKWRNFIEDLT